MVDGSNTQTFSWVADIMTFWQTLWHSISFS